MDEYSKLLDRIARKITADELERMKFLCRKFIPYTAEITRMESILKEVFHFFCKLEAESRLGIDNLDWMKNMLAYLGKKDLESEVANFQSTRRRVLSSLNAERESERNQTTRSEQEENQEKEQRGQSEPEVQEENQAALGNQRGRGTILMRCAPYIAGVAWVAGSAYILNLHKKDPEALVNLVTKVVLPTGNLVRSIFPGSINLLIQATDLNSLKELWKRYQSGRLKEDLQKVMVTEELKNLANGEPIDLVVTMSEEEYRNACLDLMVAHAKAQSLWKGMTSSKPSRQVSRSLPDLTSLDTNHDWSRDFSLEQFSDDLKRRQNTRKVSQLEIEVKSKDDDDDDDEDDDDDGPIKRSKMATNEFTDEEFNYFRLVYFFTHNVPEGMRTVFKQQWNARYQTTHGEWLDVPKNATDFYNMESPRNQRRYAKLLTIMANGNTKEWDCTCLFYALLFSDCLGPFLNTTVQTNVDELREIRNEAFAHTADGSLTDVDFEEAMRKVLAAFKALGLDTTEVDEVKTQKSFPTEELSSIQQQLNNESKLYVKLHSFCVLPPKPSHDTTDRADEVTTINHEMEKLRSTKKNETTVIYLSGNPGCGKSEIARQIGNNYFNKIPEDTTHLKFVFTFNASDIDTLLGSYVDFAARLSCDEDSVTSIATSKVLSPEEKIESMKSLINPKVQIYSSWLIIVDKVNDLKLVSKYLPQAGEKTSGDGQILVTTQDSQSIPLDSYTYHYSSLNVGMQEEDAIALLSQISGTTGDRDTLLTIASALDFQPLALACAAAYVQQIFNSTDQPKTKWENYLLKLQEGKCEATEDSYKQTSWTYELSMTAAVRFALERVVSEDKIMMHALQFLSIIANEPIPLKYVVQYVISCMPDEDHDVVAAHISLSSLVILSEDVVISKVIRVHQVVYHGLQQLLDDDETDILKLMSVFSDLVFLKSVYDVTKEEIIATRSFTPHFVVISRKLNLRLLDHSIFTAISLNAADCLFKAGSICLVHGSYKAAEEFLEICLSIQQRACHSGPEMAQDQNLNSNIAVINKSHEDKQSHFEGKLSSGDASVALATTLKRLSDLYIDLMNYEKAQIHLEEALVIEERLHKGDHPEVAITLKNLGVCLMHLGQHGKAEAYLQRALAMQEKCEGENDTLLADILINLVMLFHRRHGEFEKAKMYYERAHELEQKLSDNEDPRLADTVNDLGACLSSFKDEKKATNFYEKALKVVESVYHESQQYKAITLQNIGLSLSELRREDRAKMYFEKALTIYETGNDQNNTQLMLNSLGSCLIQLKQHDKAKAYLERALSIREKGDDQNDPQLATTLNSLGFCLNKQEQYNKAKAYYERAVSILEKGDNKYDSQLATTLNNLGFCHHKQERYDKAKACYERALSILEKGDNEYNSQLATTLENLGSCSIELKEYDKAKAYYERALSFERKETMKMSNNWLLRYVALVSAILN